MRDPDKYTWADAYRTDRDYRHRLFWWGWTLPMTLALIVTFLIVAGCTHTPLAIAQSPLQKAYALYGEFTIIEEQAAALRQNGTLRGDALVLVQRADERAKPSADTLLKVVREYLTVREQLAQGTTTAEKMQIATGRLSEWLTIATRDITALSEAVTGRNDS